MSVPEQPEVTPPMVWQGQSLGDVGSELVAVINIRDISDHGSVNIASCQIEQADRPKDSLLLCAGDVVVSIRGARLAAGVVAPEAKHGSELESWPEGARCGVVSPQLAVMRFEFEWWARATCAWINSRFGQDRLISKATVGSQRVVVPLKALRDLPLPAMPELCAMEIADAWDASREMHELMRRALRQQSVVMSAMFERAREVMGST